MPTIAEKIDEFKTACIQYGMAKELCRIAENENTESAKSGRTALIMTLAATTVVRIQGELEEMVIPSEPIDEVGTLAESIGG